MVFDRAHLCAHCRAPLPRGSGDAFCCGGCRAARRLLSGAGLDRYYELASGTGTPGSDAPPELSEKIREQAAVMRDQVNYHLDRARAAALAGTLGTSTEVEPALAGLVRTFGKIYRDKDIAYEVHVPPGLRRKNRDGDHPGKGKGRS